MEGFSSLGFKHSRTKHLYNGRDLALPSYIYKVFRELNRPLWFFSAQLNRTNDLSGSSDNVARLSLATIVLYRLLFMWWCNPVSVLSFERIYLLLILYYIHKHLFYIFFRLVIISSYKYGLYINTVYIFSIS